MRHDETIAPRRGTTGSLPRRFLQNAASTYVAQIVLGLQVVVVTPLLVRGLGAEVYGIWALVASIGLVVSLLDFGVGSATIRYVAHHDALDERSQVVRTVAVSFWILVALAGVAVLGSIGLAPIVARYLSVPGQEDATAALVVLTAVSVAIMFIGGAFGGCLAALQYHSVNNAFNVAIAVLQIAGFVLVLELDGGLVALGAVLVVVAALALVARYLVLLRFVPEASLSWALIERSLVRRLLRMTVWVSSAQAATIVRQRLDTLVVGVVVGVRAAGVYAVGQLLFVAVNRFVQPAVTGFLPYAAELAGTGDRRGLRATMLAGTRLSLAVTGLLGLPVIVLAEPLIRVWVGEGFEDARLVAVFLVSSLLLGALTRSGFAMLDGSGHYRAKAAILWAEAVVNLSLSITLGLLVGMQGVALATLLATAMLSTAVGLPYILRTYGVELAAFVWSVARAYGPALAVALLVAWLVYPGDEASAVSVLVAGGAIAGAYVATLAATAVSGEERAELGRSAASVSRRFTRRLRDLFRNAQDET